MHWESKNYFDSLCCTICFLTLVWNWPWGISEVCVYVAKINYTLMSLLYRASVPWANVHFLLAQESRILNNYGEKKIYSDMIYIFWCDIFLLFKVDIFGHAGLLNKNKKCLKMNIVFFSCIKEIAVSIITCDCLHNKLWALDTWWN